MGFDLGSWVQSEFWLPLPPTHQEDHIERGYGWGSGGRGSRTGRVMLGGLGGSIAFPLRALPQALFPDNSLNLAI